MAFNKNSLLVNNKSIAVIEEEGLVINYAPIQAYYQLSKTNLMAGQPYKFSLDPPGHDLLPVSMAAWLNDINGQIGNNDSFTIKVYNGTNYLWGLNLAGKKTIDTHGFLFVFPEIPISRKYTIEINSAVALATVLVFCKPVYIEQELIKSD
jgi:hypothetical protein